MIVVIGGGITGLAAAHRLTELSGPGSCLVLEQSDTIGGKILTHRETGLLIERGPDAFLAAKPQASELCRAVGLADQLVAAAPGGRRAGIRDGDRIRPLPQGWSGLVPTTFWPLVGHGALSVGGRARAALELVQPRGDGEEESVAGFVTRRFGAEVWTRIAEPLLAGISPGDGAKLSLPAVFPRLVELERRHRSLLLAGLRAPGPRQGVPAGFITLRSGLGTLTAVLAARVGHAAIRTGTPVQAIESDGDEWRVSVGNEHIQASGVIVTVPAPVAARIVTGLDPKTVEALSAIPFSSSALVSLVWLRCDVTRPFAGSGWLVPAAEGTPVIAVSISSNKFPGRAPDDVVMLRVFLGRRGDALLELTDHELTAAAIVETRRGLGLRGDPLHALVTRWPHALPSYTLGHGARIAAIDEEVARRPGLALAGCSYRGVGVPDCIADGRAAAERVLAHRRVAA